MKIGYSKETDTYWDMDTGQQVDKDVVQMGNLGAAWEGVQRLGGDIARNVTGLLPGEPLMDPRSPEEEQRWEQIQSANPVGAFMGHSGPQFIPAVRGGMMAQAGLGAAQGFLAVDPNQSELERTGWGAAGGAGGHIAGQVLGRIGNVLRGGRVDDATSRIANELEASGYQLTPAQRSGRQADLKSERQWSKTDTGQQRVGDLGEANEAQLLRRINEAVGLAGDAPLDRSARTLAAEQIGDEMDDIARGMRLEFPEDVAKRVSRIVKNDDMLEIAELPGGGNVTGTDYMRMRSDLSRAQRSAQGSAQDYIGKTIDMLDEQFLDAAGPQATQRYRVAREHYKNLMLLEKGKALTPEGIPNVKTIGNNLRSKQGYGMRSVDNTLPETQGLIQDVDNLSSKAVNPYIGDSGTTEGMNQGILDWKNWGQNYLAGKYFDAGRVPMMHRMMESPPALYPQIGGQVGRGLLAGE